MNQGPQRNIAEQLKDYHKIILCMSGMLLSCTGLISVIGDLSKTQAVELHDPVFNLQISTVMMVFGSIQFLIASSCLFLQTKIWNMWLVGWASANFLAFRAGLWFLGWHHTSCFMVDPLRLSPAFVDALLTFSSVFLVCVSTTCLWFEEQRVQSSESFKMPCPACGVHIRFSRLNVGLQISCPQCHNKTILRKPGRLKMSCFFCKEHIEFPSHVIGEKMPCPHCKMDITLKEPA